MPPICWTTRVYIYSQYIQYKLFIYFLPGLTPSSGLFAPVHPYHKFKFANIRPIKFNFYDEFRAASII